MINGQIIKIISNLYTVKTDTENLLCQARGLFRKEKITPLVGDYCEIDEKTNHIMKINPRKNFLERPNIANVDYALIVTSVVKPNISTNLLDKLITVIHIKKIKPVLCFTKMDLLEDKSSINEIMAYYKKIGIPVFLNTELSEMQEFFKNKIVVVTGQTGSGKSTLLNRFQPDLSLKTNPISEALGRGIHTTRHVELYDISGMFLADTPGFSSIDLSNFSKNEIKESFQEFENYPCEYKDCAHDKEINCEVKKAVLTNEILNSRYENYLTFMKEGKIR